MKNNLKGFFGFGIFILIFIVASPAHADFGDNFDSFNNLGWTAYGSNWSLMQSGSNGLDGTSCDSGNCVTYIEWQNHSDYSGMYYKEASSSSDQAYVTYDSRFNYADGSGNINS